MIAIFGNKGFSREIQRLICHWRMVEEVLFVDKENEDEFISSLKYSDTSIFFGIGNCQLKEKIYEKLLMVDDISRFLPSFHSFRFFPTLIHPSSIIASPFIPQPGVIIQSNCSLTVGIKLGKFVMINLNCTIGHDVSIGDFCTINPGVNIAGEVTIGKRVNVGMGSNIIQRITICDDVIIGAGTVVIRDITEPGTYVGNPARRIK